MNILLCSVINVMFYSVIASSVCENLSTCRECIRDFNGCVWCKLDSYNGTRCRHESMAVGDWCQANIINPKSSINVTEQLEFNSKIGKIVQIKPQRSKIDIRPGQSVHFDFSFKPADDYPIDLYILIEDSASLKDDIAGQSMYIYNITKNMTSNVRLGLGLFVDKNTIPYTQVKNSTLAYSYKNRLPLTETFQDFENAITEEVFGESDEESKATFDALAQVITCKKEIGWRNESRKIILVITSSPYHSAGDGRRAGIELPYDGKCYTENGSYAKELEMDYPSVSIINKLASDNEMTIIFLVTDENENEYQQLTRVISGTKVSSLDKYEIGTILHSMYDQISTQAKLKVNIDRDYYDLFEISFKPNCNIEEDLEDNNIIEECTVKQGHQKNFTGTVKLLKYFDSKNNSRQVQADVMIKGILEKFNMQINIINECDCESKMNAPSCSEAGTSRCGVCTCAEGRYGKNCECSHSSGSKVNDSSTCVGPNSTEVCSGHGSCVCGECLCIGDNYSGEYCQCNSLSCPRDHKDNVCSKHGVCKCGLCECFVGWSGKYCSCSLSLSGCRQDDKICNGRGECECGECQCQPIADWDARIVEDDRCLLTFENKKAGQSLQCLKLESCALAYLKNDSSYCNHVNISAVKNLTEIDNYEMWSGCQWVRVDVGCYTNYMYLYDDDSYGIAVVVQSDIDCAESFYMYGGGCVVAIILIGILTLCLWKYITYRQDRREYKRFLQELQNQSEDFNNPIFTPASTSFQNPAFRRSSSTRSRLQRSFRMKPKEDNVPSKPS